MSIHFKCPAWGKSLLIVTLTLGGVWLAFRVSAVAAQELANQQENPVLVVSEADKNLSIVEGNSVLSLCETDSSVANPLVISTLKLLGKGTQGEDNAKEEEPKVVKKFNVILTGYSSTPEQTDDTPFITASGAYVRDGIVANNMLPFGANIRIPELYGDKIFTVEDRMHARKSGYNVDIWFPEYRQAVNFGVKSTYIEVVN